MKSDEQETPDELFDKLHAVFDFTLDACASKRNHKIDEYYTKKENSLIRTWNGRVWCNPPYSKEAGGQLEWIKKAKMEVTNYHAEMVCCLLLADTSTQYFEYAFKHGTVIFLSPRVKFNGVVNSPKFGSMLVVFQMLKVNQMFHWNWKKEECPYKNI